MQNIQQLQYIRIVNGCQPFRFTFCSGEGKLLRVNRSIQAEGSFGQLKNNRGFRRFLLSGNPKVLMELYLLAISQNIVKYIRKCNNGKRKAHDLHPKTLLKS